KLTVATFCVPPELAASVFFNVAPLLAVSSSATVKEPALLVVKPEWPSVSAEALALPRVMVPVVPEPVAVPVSIEILPELVLVPEPSPDLILTDPVLRPEPPVVLPERNVMADEAP